MSFTEIRMPKLGETMTHGTVLEWLVAEGAAINRDEPVLVVATDKAELEVPAPASGRLTEIIAAADSEYEVGAVLARIEH